MASGLLSSLLTAARNASGMRLSRVALFSRNSIAPSDSSFPGPGRTRDPFRIARIAVAQELKPDIFVIKICPQLKKFGRELNSVASQGRRRAAMLIRGLGPRTSLLQDSFAGASTTMRYICQISRINTLAKTNSKFIRMRTKSCLR
jgi:hypothetical protein